MIRLRSERSLVHYAGPRHVHFSNLKYPIERCRSEKLSGNNVRDPLRFPNSLARGRVPQVPRVIPSVDLLTSSALLLLSRHMALSPRQISQSVSRSLIHGNCLAVVIARFGWPMTHIDPCLFLDDGDRSAVEI